jgi:hypothetical protein
LAERRWRKGAGWKLETIGELINGYGRHGKSHLHWRPVEYRPCWHAG